MSLESRLRCLEVVVETRQSEATKGVQETISKEVLRRMTDDEVRGYVGTLRRIRDGKEPSEDDGPMLARVEELREEVRHEHTTTEN
jgi:hypothetical protein